MRNRLLRMDHPDTSAASTDLAWARLDSPLGPLWLGADGHFLRQLRFSAPGIQDVTLADATSLSAPHEQPGQTEQYSQHHPLLAQAQAELTEYFAGTRTTFSVPIPRADSTFRARAWAALESIPYGQTWSYAQLADAAGSPRAVRAAGTACATNPLPIIVPCHRIVRTDGALGNYLGGTDAKRWLLAHEGIKL